MKRNTKVFNPYGDEPTWTDVEPTQSELSGALTWYRYNTNPSSVTSELRKLRKEDVDYGSIPAQILYLLKMVDRGCKLQQKYMDKIDNAFMTARIVSKKHTINVGTGTTAVDTTLERARELVAEIDHAFDDFITNGCKGKFSTYTLLQENEASTPVARAVGNITSPTVNEFKSLAAGDEELVEGYSNLTARNRKSCMKWWNDVATDIQMWIDNKKATRKPRKRKVITAEKILSALKYQTEEPSLKLVSINPESIIGAKQLWLYNTKYNTLTVLNAADEAGLSVKGTTVQNIAQSSTTKKVRKPNDVLPKVKNGGKVVLRKIMDSINTKATEATGRIGQHTILLRAVK
jgi:hypothetical protein